MKSGTGYTLFQQSDDILRQHHISRIIRGLIFEEKHRYNRIILCKRQQGGFAEKFCGKSPAILPGRPFTF